VLQAGLTPVFVDIDPRTLGMDLEQTLKAITPRTLAVFITHIMGYNALTPAFVRECNRRGVMIIEDVCESHGATMEDRKLGSIGAISNFSYYYAHHLSTIEGGMVCTDDPHIYQMARVLRAHGMVRESNDPAFKKEWQDEFPDLHPDFIFAYPAFNFRSTELNAVIGRSQLPRLDQNNANRKRNLKVFLENLDPRRYRVDFAVEGSCNYAFTLVLDQPDNALRDRVMQKLRDEGVEFRRGTSGGGNQLRQPYLRKVLGEPDLTRYPQVEHVHFFAFYIGNYPDLPEQDIHWLCRTLNTL
jgi:CDP-6-deoxy-D-xylo-4-hexulose-3-dehydrase